MNIAGNGVSCHRVVGVARHAHKPVVITYSGSLQYLFPYIVF